MRAQQSMLDAVPTGTWLAQAGPRSPDEIFASVFLVFLVLGTIVGVVVVSYTLYHAYKYRDGAGNGKKVDENPPELGEIPQGGGGGKKLFVSFTISAIIVLGLILWTYGLLLDVEQGAISQEARAQEIAEQGEVLNIDVIGHRFSWEFVYPNGHSQGDLRVPVDRAVQLNVTSADVFHNFGIVGLGQKADAIPGHYTSTWFIADETGTHMAKCYELCGARHSYMEANVTVVEQAEYQDWYADTMPADGNATAPNGTDGGNGGANGTDGTGAGDGT